MRSLGNDPRAREHRGPERAVARGSPPVINSPSLPTVRAVVLDYLESLRDREGPYGCYRYGPGTRPDLYASFDAALMRAMMGEDLGTLSDSQRRQWIDHLNSYQKASDGSYFDTFGHSPLHANGLVIGALSLLGGRQRYPVRLYEAFADEANVEAWLEQLDWRIIWRESHKIWGGCIPQSFLPSCAPGWGKRVFSWLDARLDPQTGWWCRGVPHTDAYQGLGGASHIWPLYQHHDRRFPLPERVIDSILAMQTSSGRWQDLPETDPPTYLEKDATYGLIYMGALAPGYREADIRTASVRYAEFLGRNFDTHRGAFPSLHLHLVRPTVSVYAMLQRLLPDRFADEFAWTDVFTDRRVYRADLVQAA